MTSDMTSEEQPVKMTGQEDNAVRMASYLDKRGKMKLVTTWKRYWFVLKDQLLLYYKSEAECLNLSACRGSLNMGLVSSVRPGAHRGPPATATQGFTIEVETRTQVIVLRAKNRSIQEKWLKALLESMALPNISSPVRTCGGPVHFRYSMENLPIVEEVKTENKKEQTLPHQTSANSHDVLGRIKRIGGQSYGGNLDTILRHQPKSQMQQQRSPQQPKIPRIKAVDRMLGVRYLDSTENSEILLCQNKSGCLVNEEQCPNDSTCSVSKDEVLMPNGGEEIKCSEVPLHRPVATSSDIREMKQTSYKLRGDERNKETKAAIFPRDENQNHENFDVVSIEKTRKCTTDFLEKERHVCSLESEEEFLVENKLYEKTKEVENEEDDKLYEETKELQQKDDCCEVENKLYEKNKPDKEDKQYDSLEELSSYSHVHKIPEDEKVYEVVSAAVDAVKQVEEDVQSLEDKEEDDYYCSYDKFSLMRVLSDQRNSSSPEPDLPPRPSVSSNDTPKSHLAHENTKTDDEETEYSVYYESTESYNTGTSPPHVLLSSGSAKKGSKLRVRIKLRKKKAPSKESVSSEDGNNNSKRKRKVSFLRRMLKHYRKKHKYNSETVVISDNRRISDEPEYESVDYFSSILKHEVAEEEHPEHVPRSKSTESLDKAVLKEKLFGTKNLLTEQAMNELKMKLKGRDNAARIEPAVSTKEDNEKHEDISSNEVLGKKPVPTPRSKKERVNQDNKDLVVLSSRYRCHDSIIRENKPPSLPPRRVARPRSPWHDVPKNNSPVYGNFQDLGIITEKKKEDKNKESPEPTFEKRSAPPLSEWDQEFQDELLGTPRGFVYAQSKWKAAEKSSKRFHDQQGNKGKSSFQKSPQKEILSGKCSNTGDVEVKHVKITSSDHERSDTFGNEHKADSVLVAHTSSLDICSDVYKERLSAKVITKDFKSQTEKLTGKDSDLTDNNSHMVDNELSCKSGERPKVPKNKTELKINGNLKVKIGCTETEHNDTCDDRIVNDIKGNHRYFDLNTTHHKDFSDDISVTPTKSETHAMSVCNRSEILFSETEKCLVLVNGENENFSSSLCHNARDSKELKEETKDKAHTAINDCVGSDSSSISTDSLVSEVIRTFCNTACNQEMLLNGMATDFSDRALDATETAGYKDTTPHFHRHSDELNLLLAQLAEITSAPLLPNGVASSLVDIPEARKPKPEANESSQLGSTQQESVQKGLL